MATLSQFIEHAKRNGKTEADGRREHRAQMAEINRRRRYKNYRKESHRTCGPTCQHHY